MHFKNVKILKLLILVGILNLKYIGKCSFAGTKIDIISIPIRVLAIQKSAFCICANLKYVTFAKNSELQIIEESAFFNN